MIPVPLDLRIGPVSAHDLTRRNRLQRVSSHLWPASSSRPNSDDDSRRLRFARSPPACRSSTGVGLRGSFDSSSHTSAASPPGALSGANQRGVCNQRFGSRMELRSLIDGQKRTTSRPLVTLERCRETVKRGSAWPTCSIFDAEK